MLHTEDGRRKKEEGYHRIAVASLASTLKVDRLAVASAIARQWQYVVNSDSSSSSPDSSSSIGSGSGSGGAQHMLVYLVLVALFYQPNASMG